MAVIPVDIAGAPYEVRVKAGLLAELVPHCRGRLRKRGVPIVTNTTIAPLYLEQVAAPLRDAGREVLPIILRDGEEFKNWNSLMQVFDALLANKCDRKITLVALGGGVIGDLTGYAAASYMRGVPFVQIPTTLLAQVDSSVGGKTGIDTPQGKNLIGAFHQPSLVLADIAALETLEPRDFRSGYAEVMKYGLLGDAPFFVWLEHNWQQIFSGKGEARAEAIATSCRAKAAIVEADEREESGTRALLNLGHTFGHALEAFAGYSDRLLHGEAIAIGMRLAFSFSAEQGLCSASDVNRVEAHLVHVGLPGRISDIPGSLPTPEELLQLMAQDKKVKGGKLALVLVRGIGEAYVERDVPMKSLSAFLKKECAAS
jgi:3-dehydroquinate synthase